MTAQEIVRRLAEMEPQSILGCCGHDGVTREVEEYAPDCLWRLAVEWVAADDARQRAIKHCSTCGHHADWHMGPSCQGCRGPDCKCAMFYGEDCDCGDYPNHPPGQPKPEPRA